MKQEKDPREDIVKLNKVIASGEFKNVHLLCGEETYLRVQFRDKLLKAMGAEPGSMSFNKYYGKDVVPEQIIDLAETLPFFSDRRIILLEDTGWFKNNCDAINDYISKGVCETTCLVFCEKDVDKRSAGYKTAAKFGMVSEFIAQDIGSLCTWAIGNARNAGLEMSSDAARHLIDMAGTDMTRLKSELDKLTAYCLDRGRIASADVDAICSRLLEDKVFEMIEDIALHKKNRAFALYYDLEARRESGIKILVLITRQYDNILKVKELAMKGRSDDQIATALGYKSYWIAKNYRGQGRNYSIPQLKKIVELCAQTDMSIKSGLIAEEIAVQTLLVKLSEGIYE